MSIGSSVLPLPFKELFKVWKEIELPGIHEDDPGHYWEEDYQGFIDSTKEELQDDLEEYGIKLKDSYEKDGSFNPYIDWLLAWKDWRIQVRLNRTGLDDYFKLQWKVRKIGTVKK